MSVTRGLLTVGLLECSMSFEQHNLSVNSFIVERTQPIGCSMDSECSSRGSLSMTNDYTTTAGANRRS